MTPSSSSSLAPAPADDPAPHQPRPRPVVLLLLDGWGIAPAGEGNALAAARLPRFSALIKEYPVAALQTGPADWNLRYLALGSGAPATQAEPRPGATLSAAVAAAGLTQLKIADSERFAALSYFFNGLAEDKCAGEEWQIISTAPGTPAEKATADFQATFKAALKAVKSRQPADLIVVSLPYLDLTAAAAAGQPAPVIKAAEAINKGLKALETAVSARRGVLIISAAGGNAEQLLNLRTEEIDRSLTVNPVPLLIIGEGYKGRAIGGADAPDNDLSLLAPAGTLADVAPTILGILGLEPPAGMAGRDLLAARS